MNLVEAFGKFGSKPASRMRGVSAIAEDGAMVLQCSQSYFGHPTPGVLRYEDRLSRESTETRDIALLGQHLTLARDGSLPIRMIVASPRDAKTRSRRFHVRPDLIGKIVKFDGDHFIVDFTRQEEVETEKRRSK